MPDWFEWSVGNVLSALVIGAAILSLCYRYIRYGFDDDPTHDAGSSDYRSDWKRLAWWGKAGYLTGAAAFGLLVGTVFWFPFLLLVFVMFAGPLGIDLDTVFGYTAMSVAWVGSVVGTGAWALRKMRVYWVVDAETSDPHSRP